MSNSSILLNLGEKIKKFRTEKKYTQKELGELAGVKREYIAQIEAGEYNVTIETLKKLSVALNITISELVDGIDIPDDDQN